MFLFFRYEVKNHVRNLSFILVTKPILRNDKLQSIEKIFKFPKVQEYVVILSFMQNPQKVIPYPHYSCEERTFQKPCEPSSNIQNLDASEEEEKFCSL